MPYPLVGPLALLGRACRRPRLFLLNLGYLATCLPLAAALAGLAGAASPVVLAGFATLAAFGLWLALIRAEPQSGPWALAGLLPGAGIMLALCTRPPPPAATFGATAPAGQRLVAA